MTKLKELIEYIENYNIQIQFCGSPNELDGHVDIGLPHDVNGCVDIVSRTIMIFCSDMETEEQTIRACIIHEFGHIIACTEGEKTAWLAGIGSTPKQLIPENIHDIAELCLKNYDAELVY